MVNILFERTESKNTECIFARSGNFIIKSNYRTGIQQELDFMLEDMAKSLNDFFRVSYEKKSEDGFFF